MKKVNVISINDDNANLEWRYKGTYLHGELESEIGYDIFCFDREMDFEIGANNVLIKKTNREATFFLWKNDERVERYVWRGYLVYNDDVDFEFCKNQYEERADNI